MHVISLKMLRDFWQKHPPAEAALRQWHTIVEQANFKDFGQVKQFFNSADFVPPYVVFDIGGNNYRVVVIVRYRAKRIYVRKVMTHREHDDWCILYRKGKA